MRLQDSDWALKQNKNGKEILLCQRIKTAKKAEISCQPIVDAATTGTHADEIVYAAGGTPTVLLGVPLWFMHTANETVALDDLKYTAKLLVAVIREKFGRKDG